MGSPTSPTPFEGAGVGWKVFSGADTVLPLLAALISYVNMVLMVNRVITSDGSKQQQLYYCTHM